MEITQHQVVVDNLSDFNLEHILECGQTFRYLKTQDGYKVFSKNYECVLIYQNNCVIMNTNEPKYFQNYFDLDRDYTKIKQDLCKYPKLQKAIDFGSGIRILNQDPIEMIFSFIISQNNNIPRIKSTIEKMCKELGQNMGSYYAFPTVEALASADLGLLKQIGLGYRAEYISNTAKAIQNGFDVDISQMDIVKAREHFMSLKGIGAKVADCILLFGYHREDAFPTDVWVERVYKDYLGLNNTSNRAKMSEELSNYYGKLSGYAQQYLFYYIRQIKK